MQIKSPFCGRLVEKLTHSDHNYKIFQVSEINFLRYSPDDQKLLLCSSIAKSQLSLKSDQAEILKASRIASAAAAAKSTSGRWKVIRELDQLVPFAQHVQCWDFVVVVKNEVGKKLPRFCLFLVCTGVLRINP